jgi:hypothetical protein
MFAPVGPKEITSGFTKSILSEVLNGRNFVVLVYRCG